MLKFSSCFCYIFIALISFSSNSQNNYYKCVTEQGSVFSQSPCNELATTYRISTNKKNKAPKNDYIKPLNELERVQIITSLQRKLRKEHYKIAVLKRYTDGAKYTPPKEPKYAIYPGSDENESIKTAETTEDVPLTRIEIIEARIEEIRKKIALYQ